ncbi:SPASM domain-containing protein [Bilifractor sp. LCP21S3_A7]|uniref:SPASM domain-containing protein n=1 Tax=Bilifractor sp. LCP21S3_A7 TaxID=3438738 RepID=UPI003F92370E
MRICQNALDFVQIINENGDVRLCGWQLDGGVIGSLIDSSLEEVYNSPQAKLIRDRHLNQDYSNCNPNACLTM